MRERTLVILKPDAVERGLVGEIVTRFERVGFNIIQIKIDTPSSEVFKQHYSHHSNESFFMDIIMYMTLGPSIFIVFEGYNAIERVRRLVGSTFHAAPGTIRGDFAEEGGGRNIIHASDSIEAAEEEIKRFFIKE